MRSFVTAASALALGLSLTSPAFAEGYFDVALGPSYARYRATTVHEEFDAGGLNTTFTKHKASSTIGAALAVHAGYQLPNNLQLGGVMRFARYSMQLPNVNIIDSIDGTREIDVAPPYRISIATTALGLSVGYVHGAWFARADAGIGKLALGDQPCLCFGGTGFDDVVTAGLQLGRTHPLGRGWQLAPVVALDGTWAKVFEEVDFLDDFHTRARVISVAVMASLVYQPR